MSHLLVVDDEIFFRESLGLNLIDEGHKVTSFANGRDALAYMIGGGGADVVLLDWRMPELTGLDVLRRMRHAEINIPVIFLTALSDDIYEEAALEGGAVDFVDKSRRLSILLKRLERIVGISGGVAAPGTIAVGPLMLRMDTHRATWLDKAVELTLSEFKIVALLAAKAGQDVSHREIYDLVHGKGFVSGCGENGYRANVRTLAKRIRRKFRDGDPSFDRILSYPGFGYRWASDAK